MSNDEEILRERMREWYDWTAEGAHMPPAAPANSPVVAPPGGLPLGYRPSLGPSQIVPPIGTYRPEQKSVPVAGPEPKQETWRDRAIREPLL